MKLQGRSVVVTGASSGMGKAIVELFVKEGANVVAVARRRERLEELASSLAGEAGSVVIYTGDVSQQETNEAMIDLAVEKFGRLDVLVNNAGIGDTEPLEVTTVDTWNKVVAVTQTSVFLGMKVAGPHLKKSQHGCQFHKQIQRFLSPKASIIRRNRRME